MMFPFPLIIKVPTFISLPSLTILCLSQITFTHDSSVKELTLTLPLLRAYRTENCTWSGVKRVTLEVPLLENVSIIESARTSSTTQSRSQTEIKFSASHLTKFVYHGYIYPLSQMQTFLVDGHIASADIILHKLNDTSVEETWVSLRKLLSLFTNTECLALHFYDLQVNVFDRGVQNFAIVPDCFLSTLKVVKFEHFLGCVCELSFAKFVMENALVLERVGFLFHDKLTCSEVEKVKEKLLSFKKSSSTVIMEFSTITPLCQ